MKNCPEEDMKYAGQLRRSLYVDNCATSLDSVEEYEDFKSTSVKLLESARMEFRSWETNLDRDGELNASVLGLNWDKVANTLSVKSPKVITTCTEVKKRKVLSLVSKIYDLLVSSVQHF